MRERVRGYADAVLETSPADVATIAAQLEGFSELLGSNSDLYWALTSPATPVPTRRAILQELLAGRVSAPVLELLSFALQNAGVDDFAEDVDGLVLAARAKRDGMVLLDEGPLGRLGATERLEGYATAVLAPVQGERRLGDIEDELFRFMRIVEGNDDLRVAVTTSELSSAVRSSIVRDLLAKHARPESARLAVYATRVGRPRDFPLLLDALVEMVAKETNRRMADVRSAIELTGAQLKNLAAALAKFTGHAVDVRVTPEPQLLGGFVATVGDLVIDTSLRRRLEQASELLMQPPAPAPAAPSPVSSPSGPGTTEGASPRAEPREQHPG
jgi:F-type H+-transporting ATPase subunit delta